MRIGMRVMFIFLYLLHIPIRRVRIGMRVIFAFLYSFRSPSFKGLIQRLAPLPSAAASF